MKTTKIFLVLLWAPFWAWAVDQSHTGGRGGGDARIFEVQDAFVRGFKKLQAQDPLQYADLKKKIETLYPEAGGFYYLATTTRVLFVDATKDLELQKKLSQFTLIPEKANSRAPVIFVDRKKWQQTGEAEKEGLAFQAYLQAYELEGPKLSAKISFEKQRDPNESTKLLSAAEIVNEFKLAAATALNVYAVAQPGFFTSSYKHLMSSSWEYYLFRNIRYQVVDEPLLISFGDGYQECTAANDRDNNTIYIHRKLWSALTETHEKEALAFHEVLSLIYGRETTGDYDISLDYNMFWKWRMNDREPRQREVVSDYTVFKAFFGSSVATIYWADMSSVPSWCAGVLQSQDGKEPDQVFGLKVQALDPLERNSSLLVHYQPTEALPFSFGVGDVSTITSSDLRELPRDPELPFRDYQYGVSTVELVQSFTRWTHKEVLSIRAWDAFARSFKIDIYEDDQLKSTVYAACGTFLCSKENPTPGCLGKLKDLGF